MAARPGITRGSGGAATAVALFLALVAGPHALGLLARTSETILSRFSAWWPPTGLELLPLGAVAFIMLAAAYALATHGSRMRSAGSLKRRRFLPALDLLLLQLGNVSFLAFLVVFIIVALGFLSSALRVLIGRPWLATNGLTVCLAVALAGASFALRPAWAGALSWGALRRRWWRRAAALGSAAAGLWLIGSGLDWTPSSIRSADSQLDPTTLLSLYLLLWILLCCGALAARLERSGGRPGWASALSWLAYLGFLALYLNGVTLTLRGHLAGG